MSKNIPFFPILHVFAPLNDVRAYIAWSWKNNPNYVNFFTRMISNFKNKWPPPGTLPPWPPSGYATAYPHCSYSVWECEEWFPFNFTLSPILLGKKKWYLGKKKNTLTQTGPKFLIPPNPKIFLKNVSRSRIGFGPVQSGETLGFRLPHRSLIWTYCGSTKSILQKTRYHLSHSSFGVCMHVLYNPLDYTLCIGLGMSPNV